MNDPAATLTMQDVAELARVRRSTVSMWRRRPRAGGRSLPFPGPIDTKNGVEHFSREDIVEWLERSGRGNNDEHHLDAPALSVPDGVPLDDLVTLLCLQVQTGQELTETSLAERESMARESDPRDAFMLSEVQSVDVTKDVLRFIDDLVEASYGAGEALGRLEHSRIVRATGARGLTDEAVNLLRTVAKACGSHLDPEGVPLVHAGSSMMLTLTLAEDFANLVVRGDIADERALRRRAAIRGIEISDAVAVRHVRVLSVIGHEPNDALDAMDNVVVDLDQGDIAVLLGPATLLCDELRSVQEQSRAQTLRPGSLVMALRLPRGLWREAHRQALGIWICVGGATTQRPLVADLAAFAREELNAGDLAADVAGALTGDRSRAFRYARPHDLQFILSAHAVVPRGARSLQIGTTNVASHLNRVHAATLVTSEPIQPFDVLVAPAPGSMILRRRSLDELKDQHLLQVRRGSRIDAVHADPAGSVAVLSADGESDDIKLDPFDAARLYPRAARTEPGDVVFVEKPRPRALVDDRGGALVASPSKILRLSPAAGIGPNAVAAIINQLSDDANEWQAWGIPILPAAEAEVLEGVLASVADYEATVRRRLIAARDVKVAVIEGVAAGAVTLRTNEKEGT